MQSIFEFSRQQNTKVSTSNITLGLNACQHEFAKNIIRNVSGEEEKKRVKYDVKSSGFPFATPNKELLFIIDSLV